MTTPPKLHASHDADEAAIAEVAVFAFMWSDPEFRCEFGWEEQGMPFYNLTRDIPGYPEGSTVSRGTILRALGLQP